MGETRKIPVVFKKPWLARNQAELALEAHLKNDKLQALHEHIFACLKQVGARQARLRQGAARGKTQTNLR